MEGNVKLMLGLIWTLIRRYQIKSTGNTKKSMLQWLETLIPEMGITNFTTNWNDGRALCTLVDRLKPGICPNHALLDPEKGFENCTLGMKLAKDELDVPQILKPEFLNNPSVDEMSVMTYISYFCQPAMKNLLEWVQSKIPHQGIKNFSSDWNTGVNLAALIDAVSPGLFQDWNQLDPHDAISNLEKAMTAAEQMGVRRVLDPGDFAAPDVDEINIVTYISRIKKCKPVSLAQRCKVSGQGLTKAFVGRESYFEVDATQGGVGELVAQVTSSSGETLPIKIAETRKGFFTVSYTANTPGTATLCIQWGGLDIPNSPFKPTVIDPGTFRFHGPEVMKGKLCIVGKPVTMFAEGIADMNELEITVDDKSAVTIQPKGTHEAECIYTPLKPGTEQVIVKLNGWPIPQSPFDLHIVDPSSCKVIAGDTSPACIGKPVALTVLTDMVSASGIAAKAVSPSQSSFLTTDAQDDGSVIVRYTPVELGTHSIEVTCAEEIIQGSPVPLKVIDVMKVASTDTVPKYMQLSRPVLLTFDTTHAGEAMLDANSSNPGAIAYTVEETNEHQHRVKLTPMALGESEINVTWGGYCVPIFPATIKVCDASVCSAYGKGLASKLGKVEELFEFIVQAINAGDGELEVIPSGPTSRYAADIESLGDRKYNVSFTSYEPGLHTINVLWGGQPIPESPFAVKFVQTASGQFTANGEGLFKCIAKERAQFVLIGPEPGLIENKTLQIFIEGNGLSSVLVPNLEYRSNSTNILVCVEDNDGGNYVVKYCVPECGDYSIIITCSGDGIPGSPFNVYALPAPEPENCRAYGHAIDEPNDLVVGKPIEFRVDSTRAGTGGLEIAAFDPTGNTVPHYLGEQRGSQNERIHIIKADPEFQGKYTFNVNWNGQHIPGSPLQFVVGDPKMVQIVSIPDKETFIAKLHEPFFVVVNDTNAGPGETVAKIKLQQGEAKDLTVEQTRQNHKKFTYTPNEVGRIELLLTYSGISILDTPWSVDVINAKSFEVISSNIYAKQGDYVKYMITGMKKSNAKNMVLKAQNEDHDATVKTDIKKDGTAVARFTAKKLGTYNVTIMCAKQHVSGSPFSVLVVNPDNALFKSKLPSVLLLGSLYTIEVDTSKCGPGELKEVIHQPEDSSCVNCRIDCISDNFYALTVQPVSIGECEIGLQWGGFPMNATQQVNIVDSSKCVFSCPQLEGKIRVKQEEKLDVTVNVSECGECTPEIIANGPQAKYTVAIVNNDRGVFEASFTPWQTGEHHVHIKIGGAEVPNSPMEFMVLRNIKPDQIIASGDGLKEALTGKSSMVTIHGLESGLLERGQLTYSISSIIGESSIPPDSQCVDNGNGIYTLTYTVYDDGDHCLDILYEEQHISSSPFKINVKPRPQADQCLASGRIIQPNAFLGLKEKAEIVVDSNRAGVGVLKASGKQPDGSPIRVFINYEERDKLHYLLFDASKVGSYVITVEWDETPIPGSPFTVNVIDPSRCYLTSDVPKFIELGMSQSTILDATGAGPGMLGALVDGESDILAVNCAVTDAEASKFEITFEGLAVGETTVDIMWGGYSIPKSPFSISVCDASKCVLEAEGVHHQPLQAGCSFQFSVRSRGAGRNKPLIRPSIGSEAQYIIDVSSDEVDQHTVVCTPWMIGEQQLDIFWGDDEIPESPLSFSVFDPNKCHVSGLPDSSTFIPVIGEDMIFSIDQSEAGPGKVTVIAKTLDGEEELLPFTKDEHVTSFKYSPCIPGNFELFLQFNGVSILKTPWISEVPDPLQFRVTHPKGTGKVYEPVKFFITGVTEQKQNFKVTAVHPDHPAIVSIEPSREGNTAVVTFTPEAVGEYLVHVKHAFQDIEGSPFIVDVVNPSAVDIISPPPAQAAVNEECIITLKSTNAGNGPLTCQITSLTGDSLSTASESTVEDSNEDIKRLSFKAEGVGTSEITLRWGDHIVSPSPYTINFIDPSKVLISCVKFEEGNALSQGESIDVIINCCEAGQANTEVKVNNKSSEVNSTAINLQDNKDGTFTATLTPWKSGNHELLVTFGGYVVPETPIQFEVQQIIDSRGISAVGEGLQTALVGEPSIIVINASMPGLLVDGLLTAKCVQVTERSDEEEQDSESKEAKEAVMEFSDVGDGTYNLGLLYPQVGKYILHIDYRDQPIYQSPFTITVVEAPNAEKCRVAGMAIEKTKRGQAFLVSQAIQFIVETTLAGNGYLLCTVQDPSGDPVRVFSHDEENDGQRFCYLQFDPYEVGNYRVQVFWSSEPVPGAPLTFSVVDPTRCLVQGLPLPNNGAVQIGEEIEFAIASGNCGIESPKAYLTTNKDEKEDTLEAIVTEGNVFKYRCPTEEPGNYNINVTIGGCHIPGSPFRCEILDPNQFAIFGLNLKAKYAVVCEPVSFKIQGQPPEGEEFMVIAHGPLADLTCDMTITSESLRESSFIPIEPGSYEVFIECANKHVPGSPFTVNVADPSKCQILEVPSQMQVNVKHEMIVKTRGAGLGDLNVVVANEGEESNINICIEDQGLDTFCISLEPLRVGEIQLETSWAGYPIPQSPLQLCICDANQCKVYGQAILSKKGKVGEEISFTIVSTKAGTGRPHVKAQGPSAQYTVTPREVGENKHEVHFTPWEVGEHTVDVLWGNVKIPNSPFMINVEKNVGGLPTCHATGEGLKKAITGKHAMFTLVSSEVGLLEKGVLKVSVTGVRGHAEVTIKDMNDGCYQVKYLPPNPGAYIASITYHDRQIPGSPFKISCVPGPDASKCRVEGLHPNSLFLTGSPIEFTVNSSEAGHGQLRVFVQGPKDYHPKVYVADDGKGIHSVKFDAMQQGKYFIVVAWAEKHVPGSPFKIRVHPAPDASKVVAEGPGLSNGSLQGETSFTIDTKQAGIGTLLIRVHGIKDSFKIEASPLKADDPRVLITNYSPKMPGDYVIFVRWSGVHVPGSPFKIHISGDEEGETEIQIDTKKLIRGVVKRQSTDGAVKQRISRKISTEDDGEIPKRKPRRTSSRGEGIVSPSSLPPQEKARHSSRKEREAHTDQNKQMRVISRRISKKDLAGATSSVPEPPQKHGIFHGLFQSPQKRMTRTRSGSALPSVGPVKPKLKMKKNPSMGQMPLFMPQSK